MIYYDLNKKRLIEARALLGRLEYQRGNVKLAFRVFDGIDVQAPIQRLQSISTEKIPKKACSHTDSELSGPHQGANLVLEAIYLKTKSLQKLDRINDAAEECKKVLDGVEKIFPHGIPDTFVDTRLQETISRVFELLPQLWAEAGHYEEAVSSYRRALLTRWNLDNESCTRIQNNFAVFLLYSGVEVSPPTTSTHVEGTYVPKNNFEEAILLLMICMRNFALGKAKWDPTVVEHLTFALSICSQTPILANQLEEVIPGVIHRVDLWKTLALCCSGIGQSKPALDLLKKGLHKHEKPDDIMSLLLAAKICSEDGLLAAEGIEYAQRALNNCKKRNKHLNSVCLRVLGLCYGKHAGVSSSDYERSHLQSKALKSLDEAISLEPENSDLVFELAIQYAMQRNLNNALRLAKQYIDVTGGSMLCGWRLLALIISTQQRFSEAEVVTDAALDETVKWDQGPLLRLKAKLRIAQSRHLDAIDTYRHLLALVQAQKKSYGPLHSTHQVKGSNLTSCTFEGGRDGRKWSGVSLVRPHTSESMTCPSQIEDERVNEYEVWQGLADLYSSLARWKDAEICLGKAREIVECSSETLHTKGAKKKWNTGFRKACIIEDFTLNIHANCPRIYRAGLISGRVIRVRRAYYINSKENKTLDSIKKDNSLNCWVITSTCATSLSQELRSDVSKEYRHPRQRLGIGRLLHSQGVKNSISKQYFK
ncbi:protein NPG1 [Tanacetum coccineum]